MLLFPVVLSTGDTYDPLEDGEEWTSESCGSSTPFRRLGGRICRVLVEICGFGLTWRSRNRSLGQVVVAVDEWLDDAVWKVVFSCMGWGRCKVLMAVVMEQVKGVDVNRL